MAGGRVELRETRASVLGLPILVAVCLGAIVIRQLFVHPPSTIVFVVCAAVALLNVLFSRYLLRTGRARLVVTPDDITFIPRQGKSFKGAKPQVIHRAEGSTLSFRLQSNGIIANQFQYLLKLRDDTTGTEILPGPFGRRKIRQACLSQGWTFS